MCRQFDGVMLEILVNFYNEDGRHQAHESWCWSYPYCRALMKILLVGHGQSPCHDLGLRALYIEAGPSCAQS